MMLVTRPNHDGGTNYLYYWSGKIIQEARQKGWQVVDLAKKKANRKNFVSYVKKHRPDLVWVNGHGNDTSVTGFDNEVLLDVKDGWFNLSVTVFVARSCRCGRKLGRFMVENGVKAFIGYIDDYIIKTSNKYATRPWLDPVAGIYLEPSNYIVKSLIKGHGVGEADRRSKEMMMKNLHAILLKDADDKSDLGRWLWHDYKCQVVMGDREVRI